MAKHLIQHEMGTVQASLRSEEANEVMLHGVHVENSTMWFGDLAFKRDDRSRCDLQSVGIQEKNSVRCYKAVETVTSAINIRLGIGIT